MGEAGLANRDRRAHATPDLRLAKKKRKATTAQNNNVGGKNTQMQELEKSPTVKALQGGRSLLQ